MDESTQGSTGVLRRVLIGASIALVTYGAVVASIWAVARESDDDRAVFTARPGAPVFSASDLSSEDLALVNRATGIPNEKAVVGSPLRVTLPSVGLSASIVRVDKAPDELKVPEDTGVAGWYEWTPRPGMPGASVLVGHVDSQDGPGAFYALAQAEAGDRVRVHYRDGAIATFVVTRGEWHPKTDFPRPRVFRRTGGATIRLITCGGEFDSATGHYLYNYILFARLVSIDP